MTADTDAREARATAPPACPASATPPPPEVRYALRLIMLAGSEADTGRRGGAGRIDNTTDDGADAS